MSSRTTPSPRVLFPGGAPWGAAQLFLAGFAAGQRPGSAFGLASLTSLATSQGAGALGNLPALTDGFSAAFLTAAGIAATGALATLALMRGKPHPTDAPAASVPAQGETESRQKAAN
ncbi:hypothetical protein [Streptomyces sp. H27-S2]|uniref:hypothetical protein n=1 Tax=Streptomyces antarcticus TaxID=2996458 RepID=UPI00226F890C|nr:hypothetical protein [Streptomyces sp. H27-S2]MCY0949861.1 hypothetical protein [Streptomyces sp. H27-S2]